MFKNGGQGQNFKDKRLYSGGRLLIQRYSGEKQMSIIE